MLIECSHCATRFNIADRLMKPGGIKIRCAKCKEIFEAHPPDEEQAPAPIEVSPEPPAEEPPPENTPSSFEPPPESPSSEPLPQEPPGSEEGQDIGDDSELESISFDEGFSSSDEADPFSFPDEAASQGEANEDEFELPPEMELSAAPDPEMDDLFSSLAEKTSEGAGESAAEEIPDLPFERDLEEDSETEGFSFDEEEDSGESISLVETPQDDSTEEGSYDFGEEAFSENDAEVSGGSEDAFSFDSDEDPFADSEYSFDEPGDDSSIDSGVEEFSFDEEGDEEEEEPLPFSEVSLDGAPSEDFTPPQDEEIGLNFKEPQPDAAGQSFTPPPLAESSETTSGESKKQPPRRRQSTSRVSRKKKRKGSRPLLALVVLLVAVGIACGAVYFQQGAKPFQALLDSVLGTKAPQVEAGSIELGEFSGFYIANIQAGELFVISGTATNRYPEARANIQVKGMLYGPKGKLLLQQTVYAGNPMDERALRTLSFSKIQENMNNQFGDSLSNFNVEPGRSIPFTVVFHDLPETLSEFTVELVGSRPAAQD